MIGRVGKSNYGKDLPLNISPIQLIYLFMGQFLQKAILKNIFFFKTLENVAYQRHSIIGRFGFACVKTSALLITGPGSIPCRVFCKFSQKQYLSLFSFQNDNSYTNFYIIVLVHSNM